MTILVQQQLRELAQAAPHKDWRAGSYYGKPFLADIEVLADTPDGLMVVMQGNQNFIAESVATVAFVGAASPATVLALLDEVDRLNALVIERETVRIGHSLQRHDDQKQIDELVAMGIQQDKDEIARLTRENDQWRRNYEHLLEQHMPRTGDGCQEGWSRVVEAQELQGRLSEAEATAEKLRDLLRLVVSELPHRNSGSDGNAPGHGHRTPGVWDGDNGELSGKPCAWCAIWAAAKAEVARHA